MATSGRVQTGTYKTSSFFVNWERTGYDVNGNYSTIKWVAGLNITGGDDWYSNAVKINSIVIAGTTVYSGGTFSNISDAGDHVLASGTINVYHNDDGTRTFNIAISGWLYSFGNTSGNKDFTLDTIPRYFSSTPKLELVSKTETSVTLKWTTSENASRSQYRIGTGSWVDVETGINKKSGTITINGLSPNTNYTFYGDFMRKDSGLWCQTKPSINVTTYNYPHITAILTKELAIGEDALVSVYNPLKRHCTAYVRQDSKSGALLGSIEGFTSGSGDYIVYTDANAMYSSIPNSTSGTCVYYLVSSNPSHTSGTKSGKYKVKGTEVPTFSNFTYKDTNSTVTNITGNDQVLVKGISNLQVTIPSANKMVAKNGATPNKYIAVIDSLNKSANYSTSDLTINVGTVTNAGSRRLTVTAYDSRNLSTSVYKDITVHDYAKPVINIDISRLNNFESQTTLKVNGTYTKLTINGTDKNTMSYVRYRYREVGGTWSSWVTISTTIVSGKFTCNDIILSLDNTKAFEFEVTAGDSLSSNVVTGKINVGEAIFFISSNQKKCYINNKEVLPKEDMLKETYPVGAIYTSSNNVNPSTLFGGTWKQLRTFYGGELLGYGYCSPTTTGEVQVSNQMCSFADDSVGQERTYHVVNYLDGVITGQYQALLIKTKGVVGMVEAVMSLCGYGGTGLKGFWFRTNGNTLPSGVTEIMNANARKPLISGAVNGAYGGTNYHVMYKVDTTNDVEFYVNPRYLPYGGEFTPGSGGVGVELMVKVYAKGGTHYMWQRTA